MLKKTPALLVAAFLLPIVVVLARHRDTIVEDLKPSPENGYLVYVTTDTWGPCRTTKPAVAELRKEGYDIETVDFRRQRARVQTLGITSVPAFIFYSNGEEVRRACGNLSRDEIRQMFRSPDSLF